MKEITIRASSSYKVLLGCDLMSNLAPNILKVYSGKKIALITDKNVAGLYLDILLEQLSGKFNVCPIVVEGGEDSKSGESFFDVFLMFWRRSFLLG